MPDVRRASDDHRLHRLRGLLRLARRVARAARTRKGNDTSRLIGPRILKAMRRAILGLLAAAVVVAACSGGTATGSPSPTRTPDIRRTKLDIAYSAFVSQDVHRATSKKALEAALAAVKQEIVTGG